MATLAPTLDLSTTTNEAAILNRAGAEVQFSKNGYCPTDPDIQLQKKGRFGGWKTVNKFCPRCEQRFQVWLRAQPVNGQEPQQNNGST
jgi:hypothetical protein